MCYQVYQHTLVHDVRPTIQWCSDEAQDISIVSPYAEPKPCECDNQDSTIATWLRCSFGHKCCYLVSRIVRCTKTTLSSAKFGGNNDIKFVPHFEDVRVKKHCANLIPYHVYSPAQRVYSKENELDNVYGSEQDEGWYPWPILDGQIGRSENQHEVFPPHSETIAKIRRTILAYEARIKKFATALQRLKEWHGKGRMDDQEVFDEKRPFGPSLENLQKMDKLGTELAEMRIRLAIKRMLFDAIASGLTGRRGGEADTRLEST